MSFLNSQHKSLGPTGTVLLLQVPRTNDKKELAAEQLFASLHGLLTTQPKYSFLSPIRETISFEIAVINRRIGFYVWVPSKLKSFIQEQIYAQYPTVHITEVDDYTKTDTKSKLQLTAELKLTANQALPIKTFPSFEVDPLAAITAALAQFTEDEEAWIQLILKPAGESWQKKSENYAANLRGTQSSNLSLLSALWAPPTT